MLGECTRRFRIGDFKAFHASLISPHALKWGPTSELLDTTLKGPKVSPRRFYSKGSGTPVEVIISAP